MTERKPKVWCAPGEHLFDGEGRVKVPVGNWPITSVAAWACPEHDPDKPAEFVRAYHSWIWLAPEKIEDTTGFLEIYNIHVAPLVGRPSAGLEEFIVDGEYDPSEFSIWAETIWHYAVMAKLEYVQSVFDDLLKDGPDVDVNL